MKAVQQLLVQIRETLGRLTGQAAQGSHRSIADPAEHVAETARRVASTEEQGAHRIRSSDPGSGSAEPHRPTTDYDARSGRTTDGGFDPNSPVSTRNLPPLDQLEHRHLPGGTGENYLILFEGRPIGVYKPRKSEDSIRNEVTAWEGSQRLGVGNVPHTREWMGHKGRGTLQAFVPNDGPGLGFETDKGRETAAFDYIMANVDGHAENAIRSRTGEIVRIDNEGIMPDRLSNNANIMRSTYVTENLGVPLPTRVVDRLNEVDPREFSEFLQSRGYSQTASDWAADRLREAQGGVINGDSWRCAILDDYMQVGYPPGYSNLGEYWDAHPPLRDEIG